MASGDALPVPRKNVAYRVTFPILDADGDLVTGAAGLDSEISKDGGTFVDCTNEAVEIATNSGMYFLDLIAAEMNADTVAIIIKTSTGGAKTTPVVLYPEETGDIRANITQLATDVLTAASLKTDMAEEIADEILSRAISNVEPGVGFRTLYGAVASLVNRSRINALNQLEIYRVDDTTILVTIPGTVDSALLPIRELDPP